MRKVLTTGILITVLFHNTYAQKKVLLYAAGNFGIASAKLQPKGTTTISSKLSGGLGAQLAVQVSKRLFIVAQPAVDFRGYVSSNAANKYDVSATYIDIPAAIEYHYNLFKDVQEKNEPYPFFIGAGFYGGFAVAGKYVDNYTNDPSVKIKFGESNTDNRSRTDYGLNFVAGLTVSDWGFGHFKTNLRFGLQDQVGLKNVVPKDRQAGGNEIKLRNLSLFLAVKI